jgi:hypothetical protein
MKLNGKRYDVKDQDIGDVFRGFRGTYLVIRINGNKAYINLEDLTGLQAFKDGETVPSSYLTSDVRYLGNFKDLFAEVAKVLDKASAV